MSSPTDENNPLLPPSSHLATPSRSKLGARRYLPNGTGTPGSSPERERSDKAKGKQRAVDVSDDDSNQNSHNAGPGGSSSASKDRGKARAEPVLGRAVTVIFSDDTGNLEVWVDDGESVGHVKEQVSCLLFIMISDDRSAICGPALPDYSSA
jgi:hypothetical protein